MKKKLAAMMLATAMVFGSFSGMATVQAATVETETVTITPMESADELDQAGAFYLTTVCNEKVEGEQSSHAYVKFTLAETSWVYLKNTESSVVTDCEGHDTIVTIYSDAGMTNELGKCGYEDWTTYESFSAFLKAGTYYADIKTRFEPYSAFEGDIGLRGGAIPVSKIFAATVAVDKNQKSATVTIDNALGDKLAYAEYQPGNIGLSHVKDGKYWKWSASGTFVEGNDVVQMLPEQDGAFSFRVTNNGDYTIMIQDNNLARYSYVVKVTGIDKTKPTVSGVKNGKTYKKAVTIKFSDQGSGIRSAKLNGKTIKTGAKVSKKGSYTLVVTDKAGNKNTVKFKIK